MASLTNVTGKIEEVESAILGNMHKNQMILAEKLIFI
jgi:hypothetical protein